MGAIACLIPGLPMASDRHFIPQVSVRSPLKLKFWRSPLHPTSFSAIAPPPSPSQNSRWRRSPLIPTSFSAIAPPPPSQNFRWRRSPLPRVSPKVEPNGAIASRAGDRQSKSNVNGHNGIVRDCSRIVRVRSPPRTFWEVSI